jgi:3-phenylpropionate/cinnamic acid dioxygenase small subunit
VTTTASDVLNAPSSLSEGLDPAWAGFIYREGRLADESRYSEWEGLWDDDEAVYWIPIDPDKDPSTHLSYIYDNRRRLASRVRQLNSGFRHAQTPPSVMRRQITNLEVVGRDERSVTIGSNFALFEQREVLSIWAGRYTHRIRTDGEELRLLEKVVHLVNSAAPIPTLAFLI